MVTSHSRRQNDNAQLGEAFSILKDKVSRTSDLTTMCSTYVDHLHSMTAHLGGLRCVSHIVLCSLSDQLSTLRDRLEERNRTLAVHEAQLKAAEERAHQLEVRGLGVGSHLKERRSNCSLLV